MVREPACVQAPESTTAYGSCAHGYATAMAYAKTKGYPYCSHTSDEDTLCLAWPQPDQSDPSGWSCEAAVYSAGANSSVATQAVEFTALSTGVVSASTLVYLAQQDPVKSHWCHRLPHTRPAENPTRGSAPYRSPSLLPDPALHPRRRWRCIRLRATLTVHLQPLPAPVPLRAEYSATTTPARSEGSGPHSSSRIHRLLRSSGRCRARSRRCVRPPICEYGVVIVIS